MLTDISDAGMIKWRDDMFLMIQSWCNAARLVWACEKDMELAKETGVLIYRT